MNGSIIVHTIHISLSSDNLRPDIVLRDQATGNAVVVDVTIPYEAGPDAFQKARAEKEQKYSGLREWMKAQDNFNTVEVHAFIVGSLGAWDPANSSALRALGVRRAYTPLFQKLCSSDAISGSLDIWRARSRSKSSTNNRTTQQNP